MAWFEAVLGLHVNVHRSKIYKFNEVINWEATLDIWGCLEHRFLDLISTCLLAQTTNLNLLGSLLFISSEPG